ncbi:MAG: hypothetical protein IPG77_16275 [Betaproteobacteria bacterium]|nr:hypothetical protein [Betaproteobacteria bacterium]
MVTPRRYVKQDHAIKISGDIYGGDFRHRPELAADFTKHVKWQSRWGYYLQIAAATVDQRALVEPTETAHAGDGGSRRPADPYVQRQADAVADPEQRVEGVRLRPPLSDDASG